MFRIPVVYPATAVRTSPWHLDRGKAAAEGVGMPERAPIAHRLRPARLADVVGQEAAVGQGSALSAALRAGRVGSLIWAGPPGSGKTTIARLVAAELGAPLLELNATESGIGELRKLLAEAAAVVDGPRPVLFIDELHRYSKSQQDALLAAVERGTVTLIGATTESPWAGAVIPALLSRATVLTLAAIEEAALRALLERGLTAIGEDGLPAAADEDARRNAVGFADGDGRRLLTILEAAAAIAAGEGRAEIGVRDVVRAANSRVIGYDRSGVVSAMIKSIRGGAREAALYWLAVQLEAGDDPRHIARRLLIAAGEEVGAADPAALPMGAAVMEAAEKIGMPEVHYPMAAYVAYLCRTGRDWSPGADLHALRERVRGEGALAVPGHLRAQAKAYRHPADGGADDQEYLPKGFRR